MGIAHLIMNILHAILNQNIVKIDKKMKRSVSTTSQAVGSGASKRNASAPGEEATAEDSQTTVLPPMSESPAEHEYTSNYCQKLVRQFIINFVSLILYRSFQLDSQAKNPSCPDRWLNCRLGRDAQRVGVDDARVLRLSPPRSRLGT